MANTFSRVLASGTLAGSTLKTVPVGSTLVIIGITASNVSGALLTVDMTVGGVSLAKGIPVPDGSTLGLLDGKVVMIEGDTLVEACSVDAGVDYIISYLEIIDD